MSRIATIDIGSNSLLLCVAELNPSNAKDYTLLENQTRVTGLAKGLQSGSMISGPSLERSITALKDYRKRIENFQCEKIIAVATEGLRKAENAAEVKTLLEAALGHPISIIDGDREATLSFHSVQREHPQVHQTKLVFDIGGASTELAVGSEKGLRQITSLKVGSVLLTEKFQLQKASLERKQNAIDYVRELIRESKISLHEGSLGIGVAGTMTCLIAVAEEIENFSREKVHLKKLKSGKLREITDRVLSLSTTERERIKGLPPDRADVFGGGCCIATAICEYFGLSELICMDSGVRIGLLYEVIDQRNSDHKGPTPK